MAWKGKLFSCVLEVFFFGAMKEDGSSAWRLSRNIGSTGNEKHIIVTNVLTRITYEERCKQEIKIKTISSPALDLTESKSVQLRECVIIFIKLLCPYDHTDKLSNTYIWEQPAAKVPLIRDTESLNTDLEIE